MASKFIPIFILSGLIVVLTTAFNREREVSQQQAIQLAEQFIRDNGYTSYPADTSKLSYELLDGFEKNIDTLLKKRYNTLHAKAFCISDDKKQWHVGFLWASIKLDSIQSQTDLSGRAVIVNKNGTGISIAHKDPLFSRFKKL